MQLGDWLKIVDEIGPQFAERAEERDRNDEFVADHYPVLKERGLVTALVPEDLGGGGIGYRDMAAVLRRLAYHDGATALALSMHTHIVAAQVFNHRHGRPAPLLERVAKDKIICVSTGANDWLQSNGTTRPVEGGFRVSGKKSFASGSPAGAVAVTSAAYDEPDGTKSVIHFGLPLNAEGVTLEDDWQVHGMRATGSGSIQLEDVFIPEATISLKRPREGFADIFNIIAPIALPLVAGVYVGVADRAVELGTAAAKKRANDPVVQQSVGEMVSAATLAGVALDHALGLVNEFDFTPSIERTNQTLIMKSAIAENAKKAVEAAMEAAGGAGFYRKTGIERLLRDVRAAHYHPLPVKQQLRLTGRMALGLDPVD
jgi:alkylation response protein AidB-like acyl-CoA dehydrogenase